MTILSSQARRHRALEAMGLGPIWKRRAGPPAEDARVFGVDEVQTPSIDRSLRIAALDWDPMRDEVASCVACPLSSTRNRTVFGVGVAQPEWLVIGEAPGADEDLQGEPFVGQAGKLLDAMLASLGLARDRNVFIANVVKCRPPGNRDPSAFEIDSCRPFLERQITLLRPKLVLVVGKVASAALLGSDASMASLRGRPHRVSIGGREIPVIATYHPAYLLRSGAEKAKAWEDLCLAREAYQRLEAQAA